MAEASSAKVSLSLSTPVRPSPYYSSHKPSFISLTTNSFLLPPRHSLHCRLSQTTRIQHTKSHHQPLKFRRISSHKPSFRNLGFRCDSGNGESAGETEGSGVDDESELSRGESTMPSKFRYLTKEAPDRPVRWPWLIALAFGIYAWRTVLWELSNWKKALLSITHFFGYLSKFFLAFIFHFLGTPITTLITFLETTLYTIHSFYSTIIAAAPVQELTLIIFLTSTLLSIAEASVPDSSNSQPYLLTLAGLLSFAAVTDFIPEIGLWVGLVGIFGYSRFYKKRDFVSATLPLAAGLTAVGQNWLRVVVMGLYGGLAVFHYSKKGKEEGEVRGKVVPVPLLVAGLSIGVHVAAKWVRYRHLTWMIA